MSQQFTNKNSKLFALGSVMLFTLLVIACQNGAIKTDKKAEDSSMAVKPDTVIHFTIAMVDNKKDPSCGMPVTAGIGDTAHYKDKIIGFCSAECKAEFLKNPETGILAAELKK